MSKHKTHNYNFSLLLFIIVIILIFGSVYLNDTSQKVNQIIKKTFSIKNDRSTVKLTTGYYELIQTDAEASFYIKNFNQEEEKIMAVPATKDRKIKAYLSPNGKSIYYIDKDWNIAKLDLSTNQSKIIRTAYPFDAKNPSSIKASESFIYTDILISPNSEKIAIFWSGNNWNSIALMDSDGGNFTRIEPTEVNQVNFNQFAWSHNSEKFVISCKINEQTSSDGCLYVAKTSKPDKGMQVLPENSESFPNKIKDAFDPVWSPDDSKIIFSYRNENVGSTKDPSYFKREIYSIEPNGSNLNQLTENDNLSNNPVYIDDKIAYIQNAPDLEQNGIYYALNKNNLPIFQNGSKYYKIITVSEDERYLCIASGNSEISTDSPLKIFDLQEEKIKQNLGGQFIGWKE